MVTRDHADVGTDSEHWNERHCVAVERPAVEQNKISCFCIELDVVAKWIFGLVF